MSLFFFIISSFSTCRNETVARHGTEEHSFHDSMPPIDRPVSAHSSLHQIDNHSRHGSQRDASDAPPTLITHGTMALDSRAPENDGTSA